MVYRLNPAGQETVLYAFASVADGGNPVAGVIRDSQGNLYGTTLNGGGVYELTAAGQYSVLYAFTGGTDGGTPFAGVIRDSAGNLYGATNLGGTLSCGQGFGCGVVFKVDPSGHEAEEPMEPGPQE